MSRRGSTLLEFALAWPICLLLVLGCLQLSIWGAESYSVRQAALAGARSGQARGASAESVTAVVRNGLGRSLIGAAPGAFCPGDAGPPPPVSICVFLTPDAIRVIIAGRVPSLVPLLPGAAGLPVGADVSLAREVFAGP